MTSKMGQSQKMVRVKGLEPPRLAATAPKAVASTSSATPAQGLLNASPTLNIQAC